MLKKYKCTTGVFDPKLYSAVKGKIRKECREAGVKCSRSDATMATRMLLQVAYDAHVEPFYCGMGRLRMLDEYQMKRLGPVFGAFMRPNVTNPLASSAHGLCNRQLFSGIGFKHVIRHNRSCLQALTEDNSLEGKQAVPLVLK